MHIQTQRKASRQICFRSRKRALSDFACLQYVQSSNRSARFDDLDFILGSQKRRNGETATFLLSVCSYLKCVNFVWLLHTQINNNVHYILFWCDFGLHFKSQTSDTFPHSGSLQRWFFIGENLGKIFNLRIAITSIKLYALMSVLMTFIEFQGQNNI